MLTSPLLNLDGDLYSCMMYLLYPFAKELLYLSSVMILSPGTWEASKRICIEKSS